MDVSLFPQLVSLRFHLFIAVKCFLEAAWSLLHCSLDHHLPGDMSNNSFHLCSCLLGVWRPFPCLIPTSSFLYKPALQLLLLLQVFSSLGSFLEQDISQLCSTVDSMNCHIFHIFWVVLHFKCSLAPRWKWTKITVTQINNLTPHFPER